jgi:NAD(P)H-dependent FMN reductase
MLKCVAISGSLRRASANTMLLRAAIAIAPPDIDITLYDGVGSLPAFNPDSEHDTPPVVTEFHKLMQGCDGVIIASPEYAHGVAGALKNALDWLVGCTDLAYKPVVLINTSGRAVHAHAALTEIITTMGWIIVAADLPVIPVAGKDYEVAGILDRPELTQPLLAAIRALAQAAAPAG